MSGVSLAPGPAVPFASNTLHKIPAHNTIFESYKQLGDLFKTAVPTRNDILEFRMVLNLDVKK